MKVNELYHGFRVKSVTHIDEIGADMWRMEFEKNGAELIWFERPDDQDNKTFGIAFRTIPDDDTGVFHILEHSVLCGSEKYPVREPFVELLKSSLQTFLNAMTYPDKTVYPVCSRNDKDFYNLTGVYLDAVFKPLCVRRPLAFRQEGWHYEIGEDGKVTRNGVVYNEMKGAYASPDRALYKELFRLLFPDNCYSRESGGDPRHIPELTYEKFVSQHKKYYSPSNARIFLDGMIDTEAIFSLIESYLDQCDRIDVDSDIPLQQPVSPDEFTGYYAVGENDPVDGKALMSDGWVFCDYTDTEKTTAAEILFSVLCGSNEAPLTKAILDAGLAEDVNLYCDTGILQSAAVFKVKNFDPEKRGQIRALMMSVIEKQIREGVDRDELTAALNSFEFSAREKDFGGTPKGLVFGLTSLDSWLYGGDPAQFFCTDELYSSLREKVNDGSGYYENLLREIFFECRHKASVVLLPSRTLSAERDAEEATECAAAGASWTPAERKRVEDDLAELRRFQSTPDSEEQIATLPVLHLSDIPDRIPPVRQQITEVDGITVLRHPVETNRIIYGRLFFNADDLTDDELQTLSFLTEVLGDLPTKKHSALEIIRMQKRDLGSFSSHISVFKKNYPDRGFRTEFAVSFSALEANRDRIIPLVSEIIGETVYDNPPEVLTHLKQKLISMERAVSMRGNGYAVRRAASSLSEAGAVEETVFGIDYLRWLEGIVSSRGEAELCEKLASAAAKIFSRSRLTVSLTGPFDDAHASALIASVADAGKAGPRARRTVRPKINEGIEIPAAIGFAGTALPFPEGYEYTGEASVAAHFLTYDYLWNEVRVNGGAYGTSMNLQGSGYSVFSSYRDPQPARSLGVFEGAPEKLRELASGGDFEKYVISSLPSTDPLLTPLTEAGRDEGLYFRGLPADLPEKRRAEILGTTGDGIKRIADMLERAAENASVCVVGGKETLAACGGRLDRISSLKEN